MELSPNGNPTRLTDGAPYCDCQCPDCTFHETGAVRKMTAIFQDLVHKELMQTITPADYKFACELLSEIVAMAKDS